MFGDFTRDIDVFRRNVWFGDGVEGCPDSDDPCKDEKAACKKDGTEKCCNDDDVETAGVAGVGCLLDECENEADGRRRANEMGDDGDIEGRMVSEPICKALENGSDAEAARHGDKVRQGG